jgi:spermidine synthase
MAFLFVPSLGLRHSLLLLVAVNFALAAAAGTLARRVPPRADPKVPAPAPAAAGPKDKALRIRFALLLAAGIVSFACEIAWTRYFAMVLGSSTYSFAVIVAAFITGIAAGSAWLAGRAAALPRPFAFFGWAQILTGLVLLLPLPLYPYVPWLFLHYGALFSPRPEAFWLYESGKLLFCFVVLLPVTFLMGMSLPLILEDTARRSADAAGRLAGRAYAWNTWGNVAGALLAGHLLLPQLGMEGLLRACALLCGVVGAVAVWQDLPAGRFRQRAMFGSAALVVFLLGLHLGRGPWERGWFILAPFRPAAPPDLAAIHELIGSHEVVFFRDDPAANVMVYRKPEIESGFSLAINAKPDASSFVDMPTQSLLAHVPLLLAPRADRVLVVGLGSGVTAGAVLKHPVSAVDVVEVVESVRDASPFFVAWNENPFGDPRFRLIVDDGRSHVSHTAARYDVIISEPSNPWVVGTGSLFSADFYRRARAVLNPPGVFMQWLQCYEMSDETFAVVVRSFRRAFPFVYGFQANSPDLLLLGSTEELRPSWPEVMRRFAHPAVRQQLGRLEIKDLTTLLALQRLSPPTTDLIAAMGSAVNDDDNRFLEHRSPRELFTRDTVTLAHRFDERLHASPALLWHEFVEARLETPSPLATLRVLADPRLATDTLADAYRTLVRHTTPAILDEPTAETAKLFPPSSWLDPPASHEVLGERLTRFVRLGQIQLAEALLTSHSSAILLEAATSPVLASYWIARVQQWRELSTAPWPALRTLRVELLLASGRGGDAAKELGAWLIETSIPPAEWGILRACQADPEALCATALATYRRGATAAMVQRYDTLRSERKTSRPGDAR